MPPRIAPTRAIVRKALEALEPVANQAGASSETLGLYGRALALAGQHAQAEQVFRQAAQRFPMDPEVLPHYASAAQRLGHLDEAQAGARSAIRFSWMTIAKKPRRPHASPICRCS